MQWICPGTDLGIRPLHRFEDENDQICLSSSEQGTAQCRSSACVHCTAGSVACDQTVYTEIWFLALVVFILFSLWFRIGAAYTKYLFYLFVCHFCLCDCNSRGQREGLCVWFELLLTYEHNISWQPWADFFKVRTNWLEFIVNAHWKPSVWL